MPSTPSDPSFRTFLRPGLLDNCVGVTRLPHLSLKPCSVRKSLKKSLWHRTCGGDAVAALRYYRCSPHVGEPDRRGHYRGCGNSVDLHGSASGLPLYLLSILFLAAGFLAMAMYFGGSDEHLSPPTASKAYSQTSSNLENIGLGIAISGFILLFLFDLLRAWMAFRSRRVPEAYRGSSLFRYRIVIRLGILLFAASGVVMLFLASRASKSAVPGMKSATQRLCMVEWGRDYLNTYCLEIDSLLCTRRMVSAIR